MEEKMDLESTLGEELEAKNCLCRSLDSRLVACTNFRVHSTAANPTKLERQARQL